MHYQEAWTEPVHLFRMLGSTDEPICAQHILACLLHQEFVYTTTRHPTTSTAVTTASALALRHRESSASLARRAPAMGGNNLASSQPAASTKINSRSRLSIQRGDERMFLSPENSQRCKACSTRRCSARRLQAGGGAMGERQ